ncbi:MAG: uridine kinase [Candidatus Riflebacteria bacterium]|nr:uridine kinase [Candidatus Riflebacteria bacterium]
MFIIGVSGLSGSGKSSVSRILGEKFPGKVAVLEHDMYYHAKQNRPEIHNYDHPDALETNLLITHINELQNGRDIYRPIYNFKVSDRSSETVKISPHPILVIEGLLIFCIPELMPLFDLRLYIDVPLDLAFIRRLKRDHIERGRTVKSIVEQYERTVRDAAINMVQPSRYFADIVIPQGVTNVAGIEVIFGKINDLLRGNPSGLLRRNDTENTSETKS